MPVGCFTAVWVSRALKPFVSIHISSPTTNSLIDMAKIFLSRSVLTRQRKSSGMMKSSVEQILDEHCFLIYPCRCCYRVLTAHSDPCSRNAIIFANFNQVRVPLAILHLPLLIFVFVLQSCTRFELYFYYTRTTDSQRPNRSIP
jgi:hypothetical protein